ncbi:MAG TPA: type II toxin-antitoxin system PemK/MazF family toxin [Gemmataceae bacterium]|nr:type II toxin-antitoxin system PemK/MazF family toxin [Gemmataceae bacterium]
MTYKRGDVVLALFPDSNLRTAKPRPVLVVQADGLNTGLPQTSVAMISSNLARLGHPSRVAIQLATPEGAATGLRLDSVIMTDNLATILNTAIHRPLGTWADMTAVDAALRHTLAL